MIGGFRLGRRLVEHVGVERGDLGGMHRAQRRPAGLHRLLELGLGQPRAALLAVLTDGLERAFLEVHAGDRTTSARLLRCGATITLD
jgi:hypothetical protein